ncbi:filamin-A-interacting protein 1 [Onychostoma macrolepis]|nr:filamin-A-interacting protein 1 [Onychostoma macrolepis]XP_058604580.1 filamin-A-interacting protein 1 [Onychostoma macrolepis]XP_058604581.1 filamin-A-interacting protein 1 [Onychostoma macrolepis]XP_058604582.1 filamin-A-interacting protein 1 [Onychostoma macrolepis]
MRSKDNTVDGTVNEVLVVTQTSHDAKEEEEGKMLETEKTIKVKHVDESEKTGPNKEDTSAQNDEQMFGLRDLSKDKLLELLGIMEGEIQAREDVIHLLRSALLSRPEELESRYGLSGPTRPLQALQRDRTLSNNHAQHENVYDKPMAELDRLRDKHKDSYRRMLEQLLLAEKSHRRTVYELDTEKRKHVDYMNKSDDFTNLLEQERERLKRLLKQEKAYQIRKEKEFSKRMQRTSGELVKLKSFALMMVDERELHLEKIDKQSHKIQDLLQKLEEKEQKLHEAERKAKEDNQKILDLEVELELRTSKFAKEQEEMSAKLSSQESQHLQLSQRQMEMLHKLKELEETNEALQKSADELQALKDKIRKGECGNSNLMAELETLRERILEMEGKDEEITKTENKCNELKKMLLAEEAQNKDLRLEVEKLQQRMTQLETLEMTFNMGRTECAQLQAALEKEKSLTKDLTDELVSVKIRMKELESSELKLEKDELDLKEDLLKLKSVTVIMVNEHKNMADRIRSEEKKRDELNKVYKAEQEKVMEVTERLIEESKKRLKLKSEMELKIAALVKEKDEIKRKLTKAEQCKDLSSKHGIMKHSTMNKEERESFQKVMDLQSVSNAHGKDENKVKELTLETERLKNRLQQLEAIERDLSKPEYDLLATEKERARSLSQQVQEISQTELIKVIEQGEVGCQEAELRHRFIMEEAKTRDLQADVQALKEKIHELMNKEDELSQLQVDYSVLQQRFLEEEDKKKSISTEVLNLTKELEVTKRYSRTLRPSTKGSRMVDVPVTSTGVQTDSVENRTADSDTPAAFIKKSVQEENRIMSSLQQRSLKKPAQRPTVRELYPPTVSDYTVKKSWIPWMRKKDSSASEVSLETSGEAATSEVSKSQKYDHPLNAQVIPDIQNSEATLQNCIGLSEDLTKQASAKLSRETQNSQTTILPINERTKEPKNPERVRLPMTFASISRVKCAEIMRSPSMDKSLSPVSTASISSSQESVDMITGRAVFKETPEKRMVPTPIKKSNANVVTTEDSKIHIHLGSQFKKTTDHGSVIMTKSIPVSSECNEVSTGTVLRSPHSVTASKSTSSKVMSSIAITQVTKAPARPTLSVQPITDVPSARSGFSRIPMSRGMKTGKAMLGALGISTGVKMETN